MHARSRYSKMKIPLMCHRAVVLPLLFLCYNNDAKFLLHSDWCGGEDRGWQVQSVPGPVPHGGAAIWIGAD